LQLTDPLPVDPTQLERQANIIAELEPSMILSHVKFKGGENGGVPSVNPGTGALRL